ncbi:Myosin-VIIa [Phytophthora megakarya]|uniref:Myosin-VIIa n=1 Tax=Phytophthora megakarya TaxID=4795 RepID=A0A225WZD0_9STRA|nr:Myosin-VIIa [Phytophthora megakarya]
MKKYQTIARAHEKLKEALQYRRQVHQGLEKLFSTFHLVVLRGAQFRWYDQVQKEKMIHGAATKLQRVYRAHQLRARFVQIRESCLMVQRVIRAYLARGRYAELRRRKFQELSIHQRHAAATTIQRYARGYQIRLWFRDVLFKLRERFRCANCGAIEPGGAYCKYCGRHRTTFGPLSNVLQLHEKWPLGRSVFSSPAGPDEPSLRKPKVPLRASSNNVRSAFKCAATS